MSKVVITRCDTYDTSVVEKQVDELLERLGGLERFIKPGEKVVLKVNLLMKRKPERATTTHPAVVRAIAKKVKEIGAKPIIADSPGGYNFWNEKTLWQIYQTTGMEAVAAELGIGINRKTDMVDVINHDGLILKKVKTYSAITEADKIINIPKIKTHMMTVYSGAVKNLFGIIPGGYKGEYHFRFDDVMDFSNLLVDVCEFSKPTLTIMDAVVGMEGYGPTAGQPRRIGVLLASENPYELDAVACNIIGLNEEKVPTVIKSIERGLYSGKLSDIQVVGEKIDEVMVYGYKIPTARISLNMYHSMMPKFMSRLVDNMIKPYPKVFDSKCVGCGVCARSCPAGCMTFGQKKGQRTLSIDKDACIRCFCCHELCNVEAVDIKRSPLLGWIMR